MASHVPDIRCRATLRFRPAPRHVGSGTVNLEHAAGEKRVRWRGTFTLEEVDDPTVLGSGRTGDHYTLVLDTGAELDAAIRHIDGMQLELVGASDLPNDPIHDEVLGWLEDADGKRLPSSRRTTNGITRDIGRDPKAVGLRLELLESQKRVRHGGGTSASAADGVDGWYLR